MQRQPRRRNRTTIKAFSFTYTYVFVYMYNCTVHKANPPYAYVVKYLLSALYSCDYNDNICYIVYCHCHHYITEKPSCPFRDRVNVRGMHNMHTNACTPHNFSFFISTFLHRMPNNNNNYHQAILTNQTREKKNSIQ